MVSRDTSIPKHRRIVQINILWAADPLTQAKCHCGPADVPRGTPRTDQCPRHSPNLYSKWYAQHRDKRPIPTRDREAYLL